MESNSTVLPARARARDSLNALLQLVLDKGASDMHLRSGASPVLRIDGKLDVIDMPPVTQTLLEIMLASVLPDAPNSSLESAGELDFALSHESGTRFRANAFRFASGLGLTLRAISSRPPSMAQLALPDVLNRFCELPSGMVLVTGPTGSGKSTTLAAMVHEINRTRSVHVLTLEDPIEFVHESESALVTQRQVGRDSESFASALRSALRQDPDVILVGELRDLETISLALTAAETGHLVLGSLHSASAAKTVDRIIDAAPAHTRNQVRSLLSESLRAVISQVLLARPGGGRVAALEILVVTRAVANLIREDRVAQIYSAMQSGAASGMRTLDQELARLVNAGELDVQVALAAARYPEKLPIPGG